MTTQAINLPGRVFAPILVQRADKTTYTEPSQEEIDRMIRCGIVEGCGQRPGRILRLRIICTEKQAIEWMQAQRALEQSIAETSGSITSAASREVFREPLETGYFVWVHKRNRDLAYAT